MRKPSRGRPRSFDEDAVLDAVMRAFWEHGYEGTSVATLEAATGLKAPSLYGAFGSKEVLYRAALDRYAREHGNVLRPDGPAREALSEFLYEAADRFSNELARAAGVGVATVYRHFPTVDALVEALNLD
ncbi:helix-turn-helix domain-containing protein, partial [Nocardioides sp. NPDC000441]|uniref:TetR/AcrR family transcriptional regulator n=1 Tax=Nocardioides sp. NPDC000441 TaxID=3154256 RepID=UPI003332BF20